MNKSLNDNIDFIRYCNLMIISSRERRRGIDPEFSTSLPEELRIQLTTNCNLRCRHCFQWNKEGYYKTEKHGSISHEIPFYILKKIILQTRKAGSIIYFWGGEPLIYSHWESLAKLLETDNRSKIISTNGTLINEKINILNRVSENLDVVFSIDGLENEHDYLRGKGTFAKTINGLNNLIIQKKEGRFKGKISINCSIHDRLINNLFSFVKFCSTLDIYKLILGFPWFINERTKKQMDEYFENNFKNFKKEPSYSWHNFNYHLDQKLLDTLENQVNHIRKQSYNFILRFHPDIKNGLSSILSGDVFQNRKTPNCGATSCRMAIWANCDVSFCGDFPEFCIGSLNNSDLKALWKSKEFNHTRRILNTIPKPSSLCQRCRFTEGNLA